MIERAFIDHLLRMRHSPLRDYIVPGLTSWLISAPRAHPALEERGMIRMFESEREQRDFVSPHSHRFDFQCLVIAGAVVNTIWKPSPLKIPNDLWQASEIVYLGRPGEYRQRIMGVPTAFETSDDRYVSGQSYGMKSSEIHSIVFSKGAKVLFFEGPSITDKSVVLDPISDGRVIPRSATMPWMFRRESEPV